MKRTQRHLADEVDRQSKRIKKSEREKDTLFAQTIYIGTLGLVLVLPVVAGAYLGSWLDQMAAGYSIRWTISLLFLGLLVGVMNVYLLIQSGE